MHNPIDADHINILPSHGEVLLYPTFFDPEESDSYFNYLKEDVSWMQEPVILFGKRVMQPRLTAFFGDKGMEYSYAGLKMKALEWSLPLLKIKEKLEAKCEHQFNVCLLNYYRDGQDYMGWHRDNEHSLGEFPVIASVSFGATRIFQFRDYKEKMPVISLELDHGSLVLMKRQTQQYWEHRLTKTTFQVGPRINLTFRLVHLK
ncbi:alpha-ketoglutarate-dependent dioxygenase AlkB family protein [Pedobacter cryoconitis]|uniref:Alkylated DNA repair dioxygenase AlkB n=1 Tax=Pedobacter cryoconitis TaxID=188932 RepID=A0A7X0J3E3_9SPHI|nr:alpha-ketoglutarate-dependent dioxygenase AlkB [Pedobacter cryoconitis]MBB6500130.1 alkylated DNA repair dioxygenase AlkB [Pedobacter cryoconitis]